MVGDSFLHDSAFLLFPHRSKLGGPVLQTLLNILFKPLLPIRDTQHTPGTGIKYFSELTERLHGP